MPKYMNAADIVVLPSISQLRWKEQYGRTVPEAMACGKIVVVSSSGTPKELVGDAGYVFPESNVDALATLLEKLLHESPETLKKMGERAAERARRQLSLHRQAEIWWELLQAA
jgi:glycosyltransferase involved in cell wall biosynthesis